MSSPTASPLRVGVVLDDLEVAAWIGKVLAAIAASDAADIVVVLQDDAPQPVGGPLLRAWRRRRHLLYRLYLRLDRSLFPVARDPFEPLDVRPLLGDAERLEVNPRRAGDADSFPEETLRRLRELDLDLLLQLGHRCLPDEVLKLPRFGLWSYLHDDPEVIRGGPPAFWEVFENLSVTGCSLRARVEGVDSVAILDRSWAPTQRKSVHRNRADVFWKSADFVPRQLDRLYDERQLRPLERSAEASTAAVRGEPTNLAFAPQLARLAWRAVSGKAVDRLRPERWGLAWQVGSTDDAAPPDFSRFREVAAPRGRFWADPFPECTDGGYLLYFEDYIDSLRRGIISGLELDEEGRILGEPFPVLERPYHLSYPFTFRYKGSLFMMPETQSNRSVEIYRNAGDPAAWSLETRLFDNLRAVDATLHREGEQWWMFVNLANDEMARLNDELHLFHALSPFGPWEPHRCNPIVSDARRARPAGRLIGSSQGLLRPSQDCSASYGSGLNFNRILELSPSTYREELLQTFRPDWDRSLTGLHTYNRAGGLTAIDVRRRGRLRASREPASSPG